MRSFATALALFSPLLVSAAPFRRTASAADILVLQFAEVLETFESEFYTQALQTFQTSDFTAAGFSNVEIPIQQFESISADENTHVSILQSTLASLGSSPIQGCQFDFTDVLTDVATMATNARVIENLGVAAYLGAAHLIDDPTILTAAATIVTVEARHQTVLNLLNGATAIPAAFDLAFSPSQVLAIASQFISGCNLSIPANPTLTITNSAPPQAGTALTFSSSALNSSVDTSTLSCQMLVGGAPFSISLPFNQCVVPEGINGPVAIFITSDDQPIDNNIVDENVNTIIAGPAMAFIDAETDVLAELALGGASAASAAAASVASQGAASSTIISPSQASAIIASASLEGASISAGAPTAVSSFASATASASASAPTSVSASASDSASASPSASSPAAAAVVSGTSTAFQNVAFPGGPNLYTGPSADGSVTVMGWTS